MTVVNQYLKEVYQELLRVSWPDSKTIVRHSAVVVSAIIVLTAVLSGIDALLTFLINQFILKG